MKPTPAFDAISLAPGVMLRPLETGDAEALVAAAQRDADHLARWLPWTDVLRDSEACRARWGRWLGETDDEPSQYFVLVEQDRIVGLVFVFRLHRVHCRGEIGYWLARSAEGRGLMTAACTAMIDHLYTTTDLDRLYIRAAIGNARSNAVANRLGFTYEGAARHDAVLRGQPVSHAIYSMLRQAWRSTETGDNDLPVWRPEPEIIELSDGTPITLRRAEPDDAAMTIAFRRAAVASTEHLGTTPDECNETVPQQEALIQQFHNDPGRLMLLAVHEAQVIGMLTFDSDRRRKLAHRGTFGIVVGEAWRGRGVGRTLILRLLAWAKQHPTIEKVNLSVHARNTRAIQLYERLGFFEEGRLLHNVKQPGGRYEDEVMMSRFVKPTAAPTPQATPR